MSEPPNTCAEEMDRPSVARAYDYLLGGAHNFAVDRKFADDAVSAFPAVLAMARANRSFLRRAVTYLVDQGINQFLDLGSGIPTVGNVHEIAQGADPDARVVYVDIEPIAVATARQMLADNPTVTAIEADVRDIGDILAHPDVAGTLDLSRPFAVLMVAVLHWVVGDDDASAIVERARAALPAGGYLVVSHGSRDELTEPADMDRLQSVSAENSNPASDRPRRWIEGLFDGLELIPPGVTRVTEWRPDAPAHPDDECAIYGGVGRRPG